MDSIFKIPRFFMVINGLWALPIHPNLMVQKCYKVYSGAIQAIYTMFSLSLIIRLIQLVIEGTQSDHMFGTFTLAITLPMISYKNLIYIRNGVPNLFSEVRDKEAVCLNSPELDIKQSYLGQVKYNKWAMTIHIFCTFITCSLFLGMSVYKKVTNTFKPDEVFMFELWVPFDKTKHQLLILTFNVFIIMIAFVNNVAVSAAPQTLMVFINAQLRILQIDIKKVFDTNQEEMVIRATIKRLIKRHQDIIEFTSKFNDKINNIVLIEYISDSLDVATALLHTITIPFSGAMMHSIFHTLILLARIFIVAWTASDINTQSMNVGNAVYESSWTGQSTQVKKLLQIIMMRSQKPLAITIGPFRELNTEASLITMKGAYSYASVMIQKYT